LESNGKIYPLEVKIIFLPFFGDLHDEADAVGGEIESVAAPLLDEVGLGEMLHDGVDAFIVLADGASDHETVDFFLGASELGGEFIEF